MKLEIKGFIIPHIGSPLRDCQDSFAVDTEKHAFAISDGVSRSLLSPFMSQQLTSDFVHDPQEMFLIEDNVVTLRRDYSEDFNQYYERKHSESDERVRFRLELAREYCSFSAATFVGYYIDNERLKYVALGDSFLVYIRENGEIIEKISSMSHEQFDNFPEYFSSNGNHRGTAISGEIPIEDGYILLMTDEMSKWFLENHENNRNIASELFSLMNSHEDYLSWRDNMMSEHQMGDDDCTLLMLHVTDATNQDVSCEILHLDDFEGIVLEEGCDRQTPSEEGEDNNDISATEQDSTLIEGNVDSEEPINVIEENDNKCSEESPQKDSDIEMSTDDNRVGGIDVAECLKEMKSIKDKVKLCIDLITEIDNHIESIEQVLKTTIIEKQQ